MAKIVSGPARALVSYVVNPTARVLLRAGVTPNAVTVAGTVGVLIGALGFGARGELFWGTVIVTAFALTDVLDGTMARMGPPAGKFGALLDSSMDRIADAAVFGAVAYFLAGEGDPYVKARAQSLGLDADVGIAERLERLLLVGVGGLLGAAGLDWGLPAALWFLAALSIVTVFQRLIHAARSSRPVAAPEGPA
jgi:CDP-diacylglycerol--glycerol-3-phosphate 3-phosphatidyltransferase